MKRKIVYVILALFMTFSFVQTISAETIDNELDNNQVVDVISNEEEYINNDNEQNENNLLNVTQEENVDNEVADQPSGGASNDDNYQVNFQYEEYEYSMPGGSTILLSTLKTKLGMNISLSDISEFTTSDATLLRITKVANSNDYTIDSLKSFDSEETLTIELVNGDTYIIRVTDPAGDIPGHHKDLTDNGDGTYTLELTVTGESEKVYNNVNVIIILDTSGSMDSNSGTTEVTYTPTNSTNTGLYGLIDGEYVPLTRQGGYGNRTF